MPSPAGTTPRSSLPADGTATTASGQQKLSPLAARVSGGGGGSLRSPVDGGPHTRPSPVTSRPTERPPAYGSSMSSERRTGPPDGSGQTEPRGPPTAVMRPPTTMTRSPVTMTSRPVSSSARPPATTSTAAATAATQVTFQDPIESKCLHTSSSLALYSGREILLILRTRLHFTS